MQLTATYSKSSSWNIGVQLGASKHALLPLLPFRPLPPPLISTCISLGTSCPPAGPCSPYSQDLPAAFCPRTVAIIHTGHVAPLSTILCMP